MNNLRFTKSLGKFILCPNALRQLAQSIELAYDCKAGEEREITLYEAPYKEGKTLGITFKRKGK